MSLKLPYPYNLKIPGCRAQTRPNATCGMSCSRMTGTWHCVKCLTGWPCPASFGEAGQMCAGGCGRCSSLPPSTRSLGRSCSGLPQLFRSPVAMPVPMLSAPWKSLYWYFNGVWRQPPPASAVLNCWRYTSSYSVVMKSSAWPMCCHWLASSGGKPCCRTVR
ncbi:hypothetical protein D3C77_450630 [compost metagenome]